MGWVLEGVVLKGNDFIVEILSLNLNQSYNSGLSKTRESGEWQVVSLFEGLGFSWPGRNRFW